MRPTRLLRPMAILTLAAVVGALALLISGSTADAQHSSLLANVTTLKSENGIVELCLELRDRTAGETRQCPERRRLRFERAPEGRWLRSSSLNIAPEVAVWLRARRLGGTLELGLGVSVEGVARGLRASSWVLDWNAAAIDAWQRTTSVTLSLPVTPHAELWPLEAGMVAGAPRLEVGKPAPQFNLPVLGDSENTLLSLSQARAGGEQLTLIAFWASWAPFVGETLSVLGDLAARTDNVLVIGINVYEIEDGAAESFITNYGSGLLHLVDTAGNVAQHYRVDGVPELFVIDSDGVYRGVIRGAAPLTEILSAIYGVE